MLCQNCSSIMLIPCKKNQRAKCEGGFNLYSHSKLIWTVTVHSTHIITTVAHQLGITPHHVSLCYSVLQRLVICVVNFYIFLSKLGNSILFRQTNTAILQWCKYCCCNINIVTLKGENDIVRLIAGPMGG